jgi:GGDEF domain-containing protein
MFPSAPPADTAAGSLDAELTDLLDRADRGMYAAKAVRRTATEKDPTPTKSHR